MTKTCNRCNITKPITDFYKEKECAGGYRAQCKACRGQDAEKWRTINKDRYNARMRDYNQRNRERLRLHRYKLTPDQYRQMLKDQNYLCKICNKKTNDQILVVDHDHRTGKTRDLLCRKCNTLMSLVDNPSLLEKMLAYAARHK